MDIIRFKNIIKSHTSKNLQTLKISTYIKHIPCYSTLFMVAANLFNDFYQAFRIVQRFDHGVDRLQHHHAVGAESSALSDLIQRLVTEILKIVLSCWVSLE